MLRAEIVAQWLEQFCPNSLFRAVVVDDGQRWQAVLPLSETRVGRVLSAGGLTCDPWAPCGDLLCDQAGDVAATMDQLVRGLRQLPWQLLWLNDAQPEAPQWQAFTAACRRAGVACEHHERFHIGRLAIEGSWEAYQKRLGKSHRQTVLRSIRRLSAEGDLQFEMLTPTDAAALEHLLREAFAIENLSWKGKEGTSILQTLGMFEFFVRQATRLMANGEMRLALLRYNGRILAFIYGFAAKGVFFGHKIGYDPQFYKHSPGQVLFFWLIEQFYAKGDVQYLDFVGPMTEWLSRWRPDTYPVGRIVVAPRRLIGRTALFAYKNLWRRYRKHPTLAAVAADDSE